MATWDDLRKAQKQEYAAAPEADKAAALESLNKSMAAAPEITPDQAKSALASMAPPSPTSFGPQSFQVPTAAPPDTNYMTSASAAQLNPGMASQLSAVPADQMEALNKRFQNVAQQDLQKSYDLGKEQTGAEGVRDLNFYLGQMLGPNRGGEFLNYASPNERLQALQLQQNAGQMAMQGGKEAQQELAKRALVEMQLASAEKIAGMQYGDGGGLNKQEKRDVLRQANQAASIAASKNQDPVAARNTFLEMNGLDTDGNPLPAAKPGEVRPYAAKMSAADLIAKSADPKSGQVSIDVLARQFNTLPSAQRDAAIAALQQNPQWPGLSKQLYEKLATAAYKSRGQGLPQGYSLTDQSSNVPFGVTGRKQVLSMPGGVNFEFDPGLTTSRGFDTGKHKETIANLTGLIEALNRGR